MGDREVSKIADDFLRRINQGLITIGGAVNFVSYVNDTYIPGKNFNDLRSTTQACYRDVIRRHLLGGLDGFCLRDLTPGTLKRFFASMAKRGVPYPTIVKVRDALSSILRSAIEDELLDRNPLEGFGLPKDKRPRRAKPFLSPEQFQSLLGAIPEPYATAVYVCVWTGLRPSELLGLKWHCINADSITIEERYCRGNWAAPKTEASAATIAVESHLIERIHKLRTLTVLVRAGRATRRYKVVKGSDPDDLVFQSLTDRKTPMRDGNILKRIIKPAARKVGLPFVNWRCLRTSYATWLVQAGADLKSLQGQMRHTRSSTSLDIYAQIVPAGQRNAVQKLSQFVQDSIAKSAVEDAMNFVPNPVPYLVQ
jgi:integrase